MITLKDRFDPRRNSLDVLRLLFALLVAVDHGLAVHTRTQPDWGDTALGDFALDGFFILSGFLVTRSWLTLDSLPRFAWHRFLRIMPGFWACLLVTALVVAPLAAILQGLPPATPFTGDPSALRYVLSNASLLILQYDIAGILADNPTPDSFNGSLWTLIFEAFCYVLIAVLGVCGLLRRRPIVVPVIAAVLAVLSIVQEAGVPILVNDRLVRLVFVFVLGAAAHLYADRIPMRADLAAAGAAVFLISVPTFTDYRVLGAVPVTYLVVWLGTCMPWRWTMRADLSYGLYIYHWPVFQLLVLTGLAGVPGALFVPVGIAVTVLPAAASWYLVERPALRRKHSTLPDRLTHGVGKLLRR